MNWCDICAPSALCLYPLGNGCRSRNFLGKKAGRNQIVGAVDKQAGISLNKQLIPGWKQFASRNSRCAEPLVQVIVTTRHSRRLLRSSESALRNPKIL